MAAQASESKSERNDNAEIRALFVGDLVLDEPNADMFFDLTRTVLKQADLVVGHVEVPHTTRGVEARHEVPAPASDPENLSALGRAGFHVATLAGNHVCDRGPEGIEDTIAALAAAGVAACGAGENLSAARRPAMVVRDGRRIGVLAYNCVGMEMSWAGEHKAGCAYVRVVSESGETLADPGMRPETGTRLDPDSVRAMQADISALRAQADVVVVALHKGVIHTPAVLSAYEVPLSHAAIDAGGDIVVGHHAHILRGVEIYRGKPIFHGLGNFVTVTRALSVDNDHPARKAWALKRRERFGFEPDPNYPTYPFHPESKNAMIADCRLGADGGIEAGFLPCWIKPSGQPEVLGNDERGRAVAAYVADINARAGLKARFEWRGDRVVFA